MPVPVPSRAGGATGPPCPGPGAPRTRSPGREGTAVLREIRLVGRGGQGVVTAGEVLGEAALRSGRYAQALPTFGPERRGALAACTLRVSARPILLACSQAHPQILVVLDPSIWRHAPVTVGLQEGALLLFNTALSPAAVEEALRSGRHASALPVARCEIRTLDATKIALEALGRPISNTAMLGALAEATGLVEMADLEAVLQERFGLDGEANVEAARAGAAAVGAGGGD